MLLPLLAVFLVLAIGYCLYRVWQPEPHLALEAPVVERIKGLLPPLSLSLKPARASGWQSKEALLSIQKTLKKLSAKHCGYYCFEQSQAKTQISLWLLQAKVLVVIYEVQSASKKTDANLVVELICRLRKGSLCVSSNMQAISQARPKAHPFVYQSGNDVKGLITLLKRQLKLGYKPLPIEDAQRFFRWCHQELALWAWQEDQLCCEYNKRLFHSLNIHPDQSDYQTLIAMGQEFNRNRERSKLLNSLRNHPKISKKYWLSIKDRVIVIEEDMSPEAVANQVIAMLNTPSHSQKHLLAGFIQHSQSEFNPFRSFVELTRHCHIRIKRLAALKHGKRFEIYVPL